jgi:oligopeptide/dipeptide ABC transporter ATP-binding protein
VRRDGGDVLVSAQGLVKHFHLRSSGLLPGGGDVVQALDGVDLEVRRGETLGLVGETGCGKSTLARCLTRLYPLSAGRVIFDGQDISRLSRQQLRPYRRRMQVIFQDPYGALNPRRRVGSIIGDPFALHDVCEGRERRRQVQELMELVGLNAEHYNRFPAEFSGGQRQRIGIARALALKPELVVCDEPVSALDVSIQAQIMNLLTDLQHELGLTYVFIAHDLSVVRHVSDRVAVMYLGKVVEVADTDTLFETARHPYTTALLSALPVPDPDVADRRERILLTGDVPSPIEPPSGCRFHPRCPRAKERCAADIPLLEARAGDPSTHPAACHYPVTEQLALLAVPERAAIVVRTRPELDDVADPVPTVDVPEAIIGRSPWQLAWARLRSDRVAIGCALTIILIGLFALAAPLLVHLTGHGPNEQFPNEGLDEAGLPRGPGSEFWWGTDSLGRDVLVRVAYGARISLLSGITASFAAVFVGVVVGLAAGYFGGGVDTVLARLMDVILSFPFLLFAIALVSIVGPSLGISILVIAFFSWASIGRVVRGQTLSLREREFVEAARSLGAGDLRIMFVDVLPNLVAPIIVYLTLLVPAAIVFEATLSFLGLGVVPPTATWGNMLSDSLGYYRVAWWFVLFPGAALLITTLAFNLLGDSVRDAFDPRGERLFRR